MNFTPREIHRLCELFSRLHEDALIAADLDALQDRLLHEVDVRRLYMRYMRVCSGLAWDLRDGTVAVEPWEIGANVVALPAKTTTDATSRSPVLRFLAPVTRRIPGGEFTFGSLVVLAVAAAFWGLAAQFYYPVSDPGVAQATVPATDAKPAIAAVVDAADVVWSSGRQPAATAQSASAASQSIVTGQSLAIESGMVEIALSQGATLLVQGPADWRIDGRNRAFLKSGRLVARVPRQAVGFTLDTPSGTIIDLGTEFGVAIEAGRAAEVQVFEGRVSVAAKSKRGSERKPQVLLAGESRVFVPAGDGFEVQALAEAPAQLSRTLPHKKDRRSSPYPASLLAYWNFDERNQEDFAWDLRGQNHLTLMDVERVAGLVGSGGIQFTNTNKQAMRLPAHSAGLGAGETLSVELLFTSRWSGEPKDYDELFRKEGMLTFSFQNDENDRIDGPVLALEVTTTGGGVWIDMPLDGREGRPSLAELTDGKPHHAVAVVDGLKGEYSIYLDGKRRIVSSGPAGVALAPGDATAAHIGNYSGNASEPFHGVIDEVSLYAAPLTSEVIEGHWRRASSGQSYFDN